MSRSDIVEPLDKYVTWNHLHVMFLHLTRLNIQFASLIATCDSFYAPALIVIDFVDQIAKQVRSMNWRKPSVCLSVRRQQLHLAVAFSLSCLSVEDFNSRNSIFTLRDRDFIFDMHATIMIPFWMTPRSMTFTVTFMLWKAFSDLVACMGIVFHTYVLLFPVVQLSKIKMFLCPRPERSAGGI